MIAASGSPAPPIFEEARRNRAWRGRNEIGLKLSEACWQTQRQASDPSKPTSENKDQNND
jgi:hypothetical protein